MAALNGMHGSETLRNDIFQDGPKNGELQVRIDAMLAQFAPEGSYSPKVQETLGRIGSISENLASLAGKTRKEIVDLYIETVTRNHLSAYAGKVSVLESHQRNRIANILGVANDSDFSHTA